MELTNGKIGLRGNLIPLTDDNAAVVIGYTDPSNVDLNHRFQTASISRNFGGCSTLEHRPSCTGGLAGAGIEGQFYTVCAVWQVSDSVTYVCEASRTSNPVGTWREIANGTSSMGLHKIRSSHKRMSRAISVLQDSHTLQSNGSASYDLCK